MVKSPLPLTRVSSGVAAALFALGALPIRADVTSNIYVDPCIGTSFIDLWEGQRCVASVADLKLRHITIGVPRHKEPGVESRVPGSLRVSDDVLEARSITVSHLEGPSTLLMGNSLVKLGALTLQSSKMLLDSGSLEVAGQLIASGSSSIDINAGTLSAGSLYLAGATPYIPGSASMTVDTHRASLQIGSVGVSGVLTLDGTRTPNQPVLWSALGQFDASSLGRIKALDSALSFSTAAARSGGIIELLNSRLKGDGSAPWLTLESWDPGSQLLLSNARIDAGSVPALLKAYDGGLITVQEQFTAGNLPIKTDVWGGELHAVDGVKLHLDASIQRRQASDGVQRPGLLSVSSGAEVSGLLHVGAGGTVLVENSGKLGSAGRSTSIRLEGGAAAARLALEDLGKANVGKLELHGNAWASLAGRSSLQADQIYLYGGMAEPQLSVDSSEAYLRTPQITLNSGSRLVMQGQNPGGLWQTQSSIGTLRAAGGLASIGQSSLETQWLDASLGGAIDIELSTIRTPGSSHTLHLEAKGVGSALSMSKGTLALLDTPLQLYADAGGSIALHDMVLNTGPTSLTLDQARLQWLSSGTQQLTSLKLDGVDALAQLEGLQSLNSLPTELAVRQGQWQLRNSFIAAIRGEIGLGARVDIYGSTVGALSPTGSTGNALSVKGKDTRLSLHDTSAWSVDRLLLADRAQLEIRSGSRLLGTELHAQGDADLRQFDGQLAFDSVRWGGGEWQAGPTSSIALKGRNALQVFAGEVDLRDARLQILQTSAGPAQLTDTSLPNYGGTLMLRGRLDVLPAQTPQDYWNLNERAPIPLVSAGSISLGSGGYGANQWVDGRWHTRIAELDVYVPPAQLSWIARLPLPLSYGCRQGASAGARCESSTLALLDISTGGNDFGRRSVLPAVAYPHLAYAEFLAHRDPDSLDQLKLNHATQSDSFWNQGAIGNYTQVAVLQLDGLQAMALSSKQWGGIDIVVRANDKLLSAGNIAIAWDLGGNQHNAPLGAYLSNLSAFVGAVHAANPQHRVNLSGTGLGGVLASVVGHSAGIDTRVFNTPSVGGIHQESGGLYRSLLQYAEGIAGPPDADRVLNFRLAYDSSTKLADTPPFGQTITLMGDPFLYLSSRGLPAGFANGVGFAHGFLPSDAPSYTLLDAMQDPGNPVVSYQYQLGQEWYTLKPATAAEDTARAMLTAWTLRPQRIDANGSSFVAQVKAQQNYLLDPVVAKSYLLEQLEGPKLQSILFPHFEGQEIDYQIDALRDGQWVPLGEIGSGESLVLDTDASLRISLHPDAGQLLPYGSEMYFNVMFAASGTARLHLRELEFGTPPVPEPATWLLMACGSVLLWLQTRKRSLPKR